MKNNVIAFSCAQKAIEGGALTKAPKNRNLTACSCAPKAPQNRNLIAFYIEMIIRENSDYSHRLSNQQISDMLLAQYGLKTGKRSVAEYVFALQGSGIGIVLSSSGCYYASVDLAEQLSKADPDMTPHWLLEYED